MRRSDRACALPATLASRPTVPTCSRSISRRSQRDRCRCPRALTARKARPQRYRYRHSRRRVPFPHSRARLRCAVVRLVVSPTRRRTPSRRQCWCAGRRSPCGLAHSGIGIFDRAGCVAARADRASGAMCSAIAGRLRTTAGSCGRARRFRVEPDVIELWVDSERARCPPPNPADAVRYGGSHGAHTGTAAAAAPKRHTNR